MNLGEGRYWQEAVEEGWICVGRRGPRKGSCVTARGHIFVMTNANLCMRAGRWSRKESAKGLKGRKTAEVRLAWASGGGGAAGPGKVKKLWESTLGEVFLGAGGD